MQSTSLSLVCYLHKNCKQLPPIHICPGCSKCAVTEWCAQSLETDTQGQCHMCSTGRYICGLLVMCVIFHVSEWIMRSMLRGSLDHPDELMMYKLFVC